MPPPDNKFDGPAARTRHSSLPSAIQEAISKEKSEKPVKPKRKKPTTRQDTENNTLTNSEITQAVIPVSPLIPVDSTTFCDDMADALSPPKFSGEQEAVQWLTDVENYAAYRKSDVKTLLPLLLDETHKVSWYRDLEEAVKSDDKKLSQAFLEKYQKSAAELLELECSLTSLRQETKSVREFFGEFYNMANQLKLNEDRKVQIAKRQLAPGYSDKLCFQEFKTVGEVEKAALKLEQIHCGNVTTSVNTAQPVLHPEKNSLESMMSAMTVKLTDSITQAVATAMNTAANANINAVRFQEDTRSRRDAYDRGNSYDRNGRGNSYDRKPRSYERNNSRSDRNSRRDSYDRNTYDRNRRYDRSNSRNGTPPCFGCAEKSD